jgi:hypothetical protein
MLFMERMLWLLGQNGRGGYIVPNSWLTIESAKLLRKAVVPRLELIADLNYLVFHRVSMEPCIFTLRGHDLQNKVLTLRVNSADRLIESKPVSYDRSKWNEQNHRIVFSENTGAAAIVDKVLRNSIAIGDGFDVRTGLQAYEEGKEHLLSRLMMSKIMYLTVKIELMKTASNIYRAEMSAAMS